ncbi:unnamed protein product [Jaminaea pallidilutea]
MSVTEARRQVALRSLPSASSSSRLLLPPTTVLPVESLFAGNDEQEHHTATDTITDILKWHKCQTTKSYEIVRNGGKKIVCTKATWDERAR